MDIISFILYGTLSGAITGLLYGGALRFMKPSDVDGDSVRQRFDVDHEIHGAEYIPDDDEYDAEESSSNDSEE